MSDKRCRYCKRLLDVPEDEDSVSCGDGDCWGCVHAFEETVDEFIERNKP